MNQKQFNDWLDKFIKEKAVELDWPITVQGPSGPNYMTVATVIEHMKVANAAEQMLIYDRLVRLDFHNQPVMPFFEHLAKAIAR